MPIFDYTFTVNAPLTKVVEFHHDSRILKRLTPFPIIMQVHKFEPLGEGSISDFTLWLGPLPVHWVAVHSNVDFSRGFTDTQQQGPFQVWRHTHTFTPEDENITRMSEHIEYEHFPGWRGLLSRLVFPKVGLYFTFTYRKIVTRRAVERNSDK